MNKRGLLLLVLVLTQLAFGVTLNNKIKHVVVLMQENRSFDHYLGFMHRDVNPEIIGLNGTESNPVNCSDPRSKLVKVTDDAPDVSPFDPCHGLECVSEQIFGDYNTIHRPFPNPSMKGFVQDANRNSNNTQGDVPLRMFPPKRVPILSTLATEFALFDKWWCSVPGPTYPNRRFLHAATAYGSLNNDDFYAPGFPIPTIFHQFLEVNLTTGVYSFDHSPRCEFSSLRAPQYDHMFHNFSQFYLDAKHGNLPTYTFLHPRFFPTPSIPSNDQHPDHSVLEGELFMKSIYEALRSSPLWNSTLLILTWDEHGGFFDHENSPVDQIPSPDGRFNSQFKFDRLGVRVPTVMISPWIKKNTLIHTAPKQSKPFVNSEFEHSSVLATLKKMFGFKSFLTKRDEWAATFESVLENDLKEPRTDCLKELKGLEEYMDKREGIAKEEMKLPLNGLQKEIMNWEKICVNQYGGDLRLNKRDLEEMTQGEAAEWFDRLREKRGY